VIKEIFMEKNMYEKLPTLRQYLDFVPFYSGIRLSITLQHILMASFGCYLYFLVGMSLNSISRHFSQLRLENGALKVGSFSNYQDSVYF